MVGLKIALRRVQDIYAGNADRPLRGYVVVLGTYLSLATLLAAGGRAFGVRLPERFGVGDTVLLSVATHKASRLLSKDAVTSPLRAPFARYEEPAGMAELNESVRGHGAQHALGEMLTCPFCLSVWTATALGTGFVTAPRATRLVSTVLTAVAASDMLQLGYDGGKQLLERTARQAKDD
ncbi:DUF1360 domain-containing protein [Qaidamihabitans albus]|uniref:DUF1360 domain-containing protein n=1 Tax=Qaidamihabitans albus TaxID=2795733 RepID=UPI0018F16A97|nr:DUF1360 domain-containing protein [Qaidamihabitans albus]